MARIKLLGVCLHYSFDPAVGLHRGDGFINARQDIGFGATDFDPEWRIAQLKSALNRLGSCLSCWML
jgi:hypothetical protein